MKKLILCLLLLTLLPGCVPQLSELELEQTAILETLALDPPMPWLPTFTLTPTRAPALPIGPGTTLPSSTATLTATPTQLPSPTLDLRVLDINLEQIAPQQAELQGFMTDIARYQTFAYPEVWSSSMALWGWWMNPNNGRAFIRRTDYTDGWITNAWDQSNGMFSPFYRSRIFRFGSLQGAQAAMEPSWLKQLLVGSFHLSTSKEFILENGNTVDSVILKSEDVLSSNDNTRVLEYTLVTRERNLVIAITRYDRAKLVDPAQVQQLTDQILARARGGILLEATATPAPTAPPTATLTPAPTPTPTPWPEDWLVSESPKNLVLTVTDLVYPDLYVDQRTAAHYDTMYSKGEKAFVTMRGELEFGGFGPNTGFVKSAYSHWVRSNFVDQRVPREVYSYVLQFKTSAGALKALDEYNLLVVHPERKTAYKSNLSMYLGEHELVIQQGIGEYLGTATGSTSVLFVYRNYLIEVGGYGYDYEVTPEVLEKLARAVLLKLEAAQHIAP